MEVPMAHKFRVVSLFSGGMGLDLGLEATGRFQIVACVEKVPAFAKTIRINQEAGRLPRQLKVFERDICDVDPIELLDAVGLDVGEVDLLVGGPPCQSFSTAGKRASVQDPRGTLLWQFLRFVEALKPRFFLMENVRGLLSAALRHRPIAERPDKGGPPLDSDEQPGSVVRLFASDLRSMSGCSYHMDCFEVNAVNYGAPQLRERALFIGNRYNAVVDFPNPTHGPPNSTKLRDRQRTLFDEGEQESQPWGTLGDAILQFSERDPVVMDFSPRKKRYLAMIPQGSNWRSLPEDIQKESMGKAWFAKGGRSGWWRRLSYDLPCPTLMTMPNHASTSLCHPTELRTLSLGEYARIQEFPRDWEFCGTPSQQYAQAGNAVPIRLGTVAGEVIAKQLEQLRKRQWEPYSTEPDAYRVVYVQSHVRTRQWFKDGKTITWEDGEANASARHAAPRTKRNTTAMESC